MLKVKPKNIETCHGIGELRLGATRIIERIRREIFQPQAANFPAIDGLRGLAPMLVVFFHCALFLGFFSHQRTATTSESLVLFLAGNGWAGVSIFFTLSGFLIGRILIGDFFLENRLYYASFFIRRAFRIFPAYYFVLSVSLFIIAPFGIPAFNLLYNTADWSELARSSWSAYLYLQNYLNGRHDPNILSWGWSLCVEEHFYLILPPLLWLVFRVKSSRWRLLIIIALVLLPLLGRTAQFLAMRDIVILDGFYYRSHNRFDEIFMGVVIAYLYVMYRDQMERLCRRTGGFLGLLGIFGVVSVWVFGSVLVSNLFTVVFQFLIMAFFVGLIMINGLFTNNLITRSLSHPFWYPFARISYGTYLIHPIVLFGLIQLGSGHVDLFTLSALWLPVIWFLVMAITLILASIMYLYLEAPMLEVGAKLARKYRTKTLSVAEPEAIKH